MPPTVLVVDDERPIVELLTDLLADEGYAVRRAYDGRAALAEAERAPPDVVLSDVMLPGLAGPDLAERLGRRGIPVILMSAVLAPSFMPEAPFLTKPFDVERVLTLVERALAARRAAAGRGGGPRASAGPAFAAPDATRARRPREGTGVAATGRPRAGRA
jgi:DNA-binding NtrC family response regulator